MTKIAGKENLANMAIETAWEVLTAELNELTAEQRALRRNLGRRFRERRRPFTQAALDAFLNESLIACLQRTGVNAGATDDA